MKTKTEPETRQEEVHIRTPRTIIKGDLRIGPEPQGIIIFAHGAGSNRLSPRNLYVADVLRESHFATLLIDLLGENEDRLDVTGKLSLNIPLLAGRIDEATTWVLRNRLTAKLPIGYFGASTGAAAALVASIQRSQAIKAIVSRGGRPGLAANVLSEVKPPTLFIVGSEDPAVLEENQISLKKMHTENKLVVIRGASHLFKEPGKLREVAEYAKHWFQDHLVDDDPPGDRDCPAHIDAYTFGHMTIDGRDYREDLLICSGTVQPHWRRRDGHRLRAADLAAVLACRPALLIVGTGASGMMQVEADARQHLERAGVAVAEHRTEEAAKRFNQEVQKGTNVAGAFHLTC